MYWRRQTQKGFTLIEAIIVIAISVLIFGALFASFQYSLKLVAHSRAKTSAVSLANERLEYFRSLPYDEVGTVSGIPNGVIPQNSTTTMNNVTFTERVLVEYVDDPADGLLTATTTDSNGIPADYKRVKIEISWSVYEETQSVSLISNIVPRSIETTEGGGTVRVNVLDADSTPLAGATVTLINNTTTTTINVSKNTDVGGATLFSGAPVASGYELIVTATIGGKDYSTTQTYQATTTNPNPALAPFSVLEADISTITVQIGELSDLDIYMRSARTEGSVVEEFTDSGGIASSSDVTAVTGELVLSGSVGSYAASGVAYLNTISPSPLLSFETLRVGADVPTGSSYVVRLFTGTSTYTLIPDADLPGNAGGFSGSLIDISGLNVATYPSLVVGISLITSNSNVTPQVDEVALFYRESDTALSGLSFDIHGEKIIGTNTDSTPIYKLNTTLTANAGGHVELSNAEFDTYTISPPGTYTVAEACPAHPFAQQAGITGTLDLLLVTAVANSLLVSVVDETGVPVPGALIEVSRAGFTDTIQSSVCGQAFFSSGIGANEDYVVEVTVAGYAVETISNVSAAGNRVLSIVISP